MLSCQKNEAQSTLLIKFRKAAMNVFPTAFGNNIAKFLPALTRFTLQMATADTNVVKMYDVNFIYTNLNCTQ